MYPKFLNERFSYFCRRIENMHFKVKRPSKTTLCDVMVFRWRLLTGLLILLNHMSILNGLQSNNIFMQCVLPFYEVVILFEIKFNDIMIDR